jgi:hypothetical protein
LKELKAIASATQDQIDYFNDRITESSDYDESEHSEYVRPLEEKLEELNNKIVNNSSPELFEIERQIKAIETKEFGRDKLTPMYELEALYLKRHPLLHQHNSLVKEIMDLQAQIAEIKEWESHYDADAYKKSITILENALKGLQKKLDKNEGSKKLDEIDRSILDKEMELYGESKMSSPSAAIANR